MLSGTNEDETLDDIELYNIQNEIECITEFSAPNEIFQNLWKL